MVVVTVALAGFLNVFDSIYASRLASATSDVDASAVIGPSATIALSTDSVAFSILPSVDGTLGKSTALVVSTYTNNDFNCDVTMVAESPNLTNGTYTIPTLEEGTTYTDATFTNNSWGYQIGNGNYNGVLTESANLIKTISTMTGSTPDTTNIYFAAKFNTAVKAGDYTNTITFASTCTPESHNYMQDQTQATLATLMPNVGDEVTLYDKRDEKSYTVAHLADGNYWMTQNLDHDIKTDGSVTYNSTTTDIPSAWTPSTATYTTGTTTWATGTTGNTIPQSYDPGDLCWDGTINENYDGTLGNETTTCGNDKHMHIGNYYSWTAAVAMNDSSSYTTQNTDVNQSICPAGWMLPKSGTTQTGSKSFQYLWNQYSGSFNENTMMNSPLYFSYAGRWYGLSEYVGCYGYYWSSVVSNSNLAYILDFEAGDGVLPQGVNVRSGGSSVRCVARDMVQAHSVTVSIDAGVSSVTFTGDNTTQTATSASPTVSLKQGVSYTITANLASGYDFNGWSTTSGITVSSTTTNPTTITATGTGTLSVSSVLDCAVTTFSGYMQDMTTTTVTNACVGTSGTLTDRRDSKTYTVKKLADGKLWMTENLAIDLTATSYNDLYGTGTNAGKMTNATSEALGYLKGTTTGTASDQWAMAAVKKTWTSSYSYSEPWIAVDSDTSGVCSNASTWCVSSTGAWSWDTVTPATINNNTSIAQGQLGVYYNYCAASAGSYCYGNREDYIGSPSSDPNTSSLRDITSDICPYGWRLPTSSDSGEYKALYTAYSSNYTNFQTALSTPLSGHFYSGKASDQGYYGDFWSSTWGSSFYMYFLHVSFTSVYPSSGDSRYGGKSVRCVFGS